MQFEDCNFFLDIPFNWYCYLELDMTNGCCLLPRNAAVAKVDTKDSNTTPPYVAFPTLKTLFKTFQEHGTPSRIDRSVLTNFSGSVGAQIIPALRFLGLIDHRNESTDMLRGVITDYGSASWPKTLQDVLEVAYEPIAKLNLQTASPSLFDEAFSKAYPGTDNVIRKCKGFYLAAATEAKIPISPYIMRNKKPRNGPAKKRAPRQNGQTNDGATKGATPPPPPPPPPASAQSQKLSEQVLTVLDAENLPAEIETAVFTLLRHLRKEGK
jgi:hypothetical protein